MRIIDTHCHAGLNWFEPVETLVHEMDSNGVSEAVLIQHAGTYNNDYLFECAARFPGRFRVVVLLDPEDGDQAGSLEKLAERGAAGVRLAPTARAPKGDQLSVWKKVGQMGLAVSCQGRPELFTSPTFREVLDACPETSIVVEHLAGVGHASPPYDIYEQALRVTSEPETTTIKVPGLGEIARRPLRHSSEFHFDEVPALFEMAHGAFGARRMMWGSDFPPVAGREGYRNALEGVRNHHAFQDGDDLEWVMGRTAARVWQFDKQ